MSENTKLWDILGRTDPKHTKTFKRAGGFSGTAIKPMWAYRRMTEEFGPCGIGWGIGEPKFDVVPGENNEVLVYCTAYVWYENEGRSERIYGVGGDKVVTYIKANEQYNRPARLENDDEAFKKAFTDAITNALKMIGVGADVHMGMFDDNKYVNTMKAEFADDTPDAAPVKSSAQLKREGSWQQIEQELNGDLADVHSVVALESLKAIYRAKAKEAGWPAAWLNALKDRFETEAAAIEKQDALAAG